MSVYYNEHDKFAAAWLRELIKENLIAPGEVDERSIVEVQAQDLKGFTQCHFFAGIGVWSYALRNAGWSDDTPVWTGSCPCQSFSASGKREGFSDERHLWPAWFRLIRELRPQHVFGEQVASKDGLAWFDIVSADLEGASYTVGACDTCAASVGAPHIRQRLYFVAHSGRESDERHGFDVGGAQAHRTGEAREQRIRDDAGAEFATVAMAEPDRGRREIVAQERLHVRGQSGNDADRCGSVDDAASARLFPAQQRPEGEARHHARLRGSEPGCADGELANTGLDERGRRERATQEGTGPDEERGRRSGSNGSDDLLADSDHRGQPMHGTEARSERHLEPSGESGDLGHASAPGLALREPEKLSGARPAQEGRTASEPSRSFWANVRWHYCRDGKWRPVPVEPEIQLLVDGSADYMGRISADIVEEAESEVMNGFSSPQGAREALLDVRQALRQKALSEWRNRIPILVSSPAILLTALRQLEAQRWAFSESFLQSGAETAQEAVRGMRESRSETARTSRRRKLEKQFSGQSSNALQFLSSILAQVARKAWFEMPRTNAEILFPLASSTPGRVGRLRGYGNSLCAPQAAAFIEAYLEVMCDRESA